MNPMTREPLAIALTIGVVLAGIAALALARALDVDLGDALVIAGILATGTLSGGAVARSRVTPVTPTDK